MKKLIPILIIALAATAFYFRDRWLPQPMGQANYLGYVEGETIMIAAAVAGRITARAATKGAKLKKGDPVFSLDTAVAQTEVERSTAAVHTAQSQLANLFTGKREPELDAIRAQRQEAEAGRKLAEQELVRATSLTASGIAAQMRLEQAQAAMAQYEARIAQFDASLASAKLAGRQAEIEAARSKVKEAEASAAQAKQKLAELSPMAPADATVDDTFFEVGEWVSAGQPVVSLLPPDAVTLRFFVPEAALSRATPGTVIRFLCDGCGNAMTARITRVANQPEFTPPVIYSQAARAKLVFRAEAKPDAPDPMLRPGLPIEVEPIE